MADNSTLSSGISKESADVDSIDPSTYGSDAQTQPNSTGTEGDHADSDGSDAGSDAESDVEEETEEAKRNKRLGAMTRKLLADFDSQDPARQKAILAARKNRTKTNEEERKMFEERMARLSRNGEGQPADSGATKLDLFIIDLFMTGNTDMATEGCKRDESGNYVNPWRKPDQ